MSPDTMLGELEGLRALARSLVHGDADADDLIQETAIAALAHPPDEDRPVRPWLATVLRNRWRMDRRTVSRRVAREALVVVDDDRPRTDEVLDRARTLERLAAALVALEEPFRTCVIRRYLDGESAADIARALDVPAGTVRWRLKTGLERLRAALDDSTPRWKLALAPIAFGAKGAVLVKTKTTVISLAALLLLLLTGAFVLLSGRNDDSAQPAATSPGGSGAKLASARGPSAQIVVADAAVPLPVAQPGQQRATIATTDAPGGVLSGRVINWSTGDGVANAELTFTGDTGALTVRTREDGGFELAPEAPGRYSLAVVAAQGFLPFAPELSHSRVHATLAAKQAVRDVTVFLFPALDYGGVVVDAAGSPVAAAKVRLVGTMQGEQAIEKLATEWTTDKKGEFTFNAPDDAVFEAVRGAKRGWARLDGNVQTTRRMVIKLGDSAARELSIRGKTIDDKGAPISEVLVRAEPIGPPGSHDEHTRAAAFALSGPDGAFALEGLDAGAYHLQAELDEYAPLEKGPVTGGTKDVVLTLDGGKTLAGRVETTDGEPVPAYTLLVVKRVDLVREHVLDRAIIDARGRFSVRVPDGEYELLASASGWAPSAPVPASAGKTDVKVVMSAGATLRGQVVDMETGAPLEYARVTREGAGGGASAQPANAGTVTRADGSFELTGIPAGPLTVSVGAGGYHPKLESGMTAADGAVIGPVRIPLRKLAEGEEPKIELVGIGVKLGAEKDALRVDQVIPNGGAADAGMLDGDRIIALDGVPVTQTGIDGAVAKIRGVAGTTISVMVKRGDQQIPFVVTRKPLRF